MLVGRARCGKTEGAHERTGRRGAIGEGMRKSRLMREEGKDCTSQDADGVVSFVGLREQKMVKIYQSVREE